MNEGDLKRKGGGGLKNEAATASVRKKRANRRTANRGEA